MSAAAMSKARRELADHYVIAVIKKEKERGGDESPITPEQIEQKRARIQRQRQAADLRKAGQPRVCRVCDQVKPHEAYKGNAGQCSDCHRAHDRAYNGANPEKIAAYHLRSKGIEPTPEAIAARLAHCQAHAEAREQGRTPEALRVKAQRKQVNVTKTLARSREQLSDSYIRRLIVVEKGYRPGDEITPERIEAKRQGIAAKRDRRAQRHL